MKNEKLENEVSINQLREKTNFKQPWKIDILIGYILYG